MYGDNSMVSVAAVDFQRLVFEEFVKSRDEEKDIWNVSSSSPGCCIIEPTFSPSNNNENSSSIISSLLCRPKEVRYMYELTLLLSLEYGSGYVITFEI